MSTKAELLEAIMISVPYSEHITELDLADEAELRFTWRGDRFRVSTPSLMVETVRRNFLHGDNLAILMEACIKRGVIAVEDRKSKREVRA